MNSMTILWTLYGENYIMTFIYFVISVAIVNGIIEIKYVLSNYDYLVNAEDNIVLRSDRVTIDGMEYLLYVDKRKYSYTKYYNHLVPWNDKKGRISYETDKCYLEGRSEREALAAHDEQLEKIISGEKSFDLT